MVFPSRLGSLKSILLDNVLDPNSNEPFHTTKSLLLVVWKGSLLLSSSLVGSSRRLEYLDDGAPVWDPGEGKNRPTLLSWPDVVRAD